MNRGYNITVVEYLGRGHEHFSDEMLRLFDWMGRFRRDFFPREFKCVTMRPWDNFFWWMEVDGLPAGAMVNPATWPPPAAGSRAFTSRADYARQQHQPSARARTRSPCGCRPQMVDFKAHIAVVVNGRRINGSEPLRQAERGNAPGRRAYPRRPAASLLGENRHADGPLTAPGGEDRVHGVGARSPSLARLLIARRAEQLPKRRDLSGLRVVRPHGISHAAGGCRLANRGRGHAGLSGQAYLTT